LSWKGYFQALPSPGFTGLCAPTPCRDASGNEDLYAAKHNGFLNFAHVQNDPAALARLVPDTQFAEDLRQGQLPALSFVVPDQCHDMHGVPACRALAPGGRDTDRSLIEEADRYVADVVGRVMGMEGWSAGRNAIVITWDEDDDNQGCCAADRGGGHVPTIVITSQGPRGLQDPVPYNHYSLLQTIQRAFGLDCLRFTCDTERVQPMVALFATPELP